MVAEYLQMLAKFGLRSICLLARARKFLQLLARKVDGTPSPQYIVLVWRYKGVIILFKIIRFNLKKISEINTSQVQYRGYSTESRGFRLNFVTHWKINENDCKDTCKDGSKSYCCTCHEEILIKYLFSQLNWINPRSEKS